MNTRSDICYVDECGVDGHIPREYGRASKGKRVYLPKPGRKSKRINIVAGLIKDKVICPKRWVVTYIERWLKVPFQMNDGKIVQREAGTPQGGVISPVLANLFLHYVLDTFMAKEFP